MSTSISTVAFNGASLTLASINNKPYVAIKPICDAMGIDWNAQFQKIKRDLVLNSTMCITHMVAEDGKQREMVCLPLEYLNGWLFKIDARRVRNTQAQVTIVQYQRECYDVLNAYWMGKPMRRVAVPEPAPVAPIPLPVPRFVVVNFYGATIYLAPFQDRLYTTLEHICHGIGLDWGEQHECTLLDRVVRRWIRVIHMATENGKAYGGICLPLSALNDWLVKYCVKVHQRTIGLQCKSAPPVEAVNL